MSKRLLGTTALVMLAGAGTAQADFLEGASYTFSTNFAFYADNPDEANVSDTFENWSTLVIDKSFETGRDSELIMKARAIYSTEENELRGVLQAPGSDSSSGKYFDFDELYYLQFGDNADYVAGKAPVPGGLAEIFSVADVFGRSNASNPMHSNPVGRWQAGLVYYFDSDELTAMVLPFDTSTAGPPEGSRWYTSDSSANSTGGITLPAGSDIRPKSSDTTAALARIDGTATGMDYFYGGYYGPSPYKTLTRESAGSINFIQAAADAVLLFGGANYVDGAATYYGETLLQYAMDAKDDNFLRYVLGWKYKESDYANSIGLDEITPTIEYAKDITLKDQKFDTLTFASSESSRPNRNNVMSGVQFKVDSEWSFGMSHNYNLTDHDSSLAVAGQYQYTDSTKAVLRYVSFEGGDNTYFGNWDDNDFIELSWEHKF